MSSRVSTALALVVFLLATGMVGVRTAKLLNVAGQPLERHRYGLQDFRDNVYYPAVAYLDGRNPWNWEDYRQSYPVARPLPPYTPIFVGVHLPLGLLPYGAAEVAFFVINSLLLVAVAVVALQGAGATVTAARALSIAALLALSRPGHQTLFLGQVAPLLSLATGLALVHARAKPGLASVGMLLACAKPTYALPLALLLFARGDTWVVLQGGVLAAILGGALAVAPARVAGGVVQLVDSVRGGLAYVAANDPSYRESTSVIRLDLGSLVGRALGTPPSALTTILLAAAVLGIAALAARRLRTVEQSPSRPLSAGVIVLALLLSLYHQAYDALLLVFPVVTLAFARADGDQRALSRGWSAAVLACLLVPAANYLSSNTLLDYIAPNHLLWLVVTGANGIAVTIAFLLWLVFAFTVRSDGLRDSDGRSQ